jgi:hypothetical protein
MPARVVLSVCPLADDLDDHPVLAILLMDCRSWIRWFVELCLAVWRP